MTSKGFVIKDVETGFYLCPRYYRTTRNLIEARQYKTEGSAKKRISYQKRSYYSKNKNYEIVPITIEVSDGT